MTNAEKKRILWSYIRIKKQIKAEYDEYDEINTLIKSPNLDGMPSTPNSTDRLSDFVIRKEAVLARISNNISRMEAALREINEALDAMTNENERLVLFLRYKRGMTFEKVAEVMNYTWRHVLSIHGSALSHFMEDR